MKRSLTFSGRFALTGVAAAALIMAAPAAERDRVSFDHFFRLSQGLRKLETAGKPVAVAVDQPMLPDAVVTA